jgi:hypothetical protein
MQIELMWCQAVLKRWSEGPPDRPICEINIWQYPKDDRTRISRIEMNFDHEMLVAPGVEGILAQAEGKGLFVTVNFINGVTRFMKYVGDRCILLSDKKLVGSPKIRLVNAQ